MKRILTLLILSASLLGAQTDNRWVYFFAAADHSSGYFDSQTVEYRASDNQYVKVWVRVVEPDASFTLMHFEMHATSRHLRVLSFVRYDANQRQSNSSSSTSPTAWDDIVPDSLADLLLHRLYRFPDSTPAPAVRKGRSDV